MPPNTNQMFLLEFAPEHWDALTKLSRFLGPPFSNIRTASYGLRACRGHLDKFDTIASVANRLVPGIKEDWAELQEHGYSPSTRSKESAALYELTVCELYSALDGLRTALYGIYRNMQGVQNSSNEKLFKRAAENKYGVGFPTEINIALSAAYNDWFPRLKALRTELQHGQIGSCHHDKETAKIVYMNSGIIVDGRAFIIEDLPEFLNHKRQHIDQLVETICQYLFTQLEPVESRQICGIYKARWYGRDVSPSQSLSFANGVCHSHEWFDNEAGCRCPLADNCVPYKRATNQTEKNGT